jgi:hypothetical protein
MFATSSELAAMEVNDPRGLLESVNATLVQFGSAGAEGALVLPVFDKMPTCPQPVPGYGDNGVFVPATLGAACLIFKPHEGESLAVGVIKTDNSEAKVISTPNPGRPWAPRS